MLLWLKKFILKFYLLYEYLHPIVCVESFNYWKIFLQSDDIRIYFIPECLEILPKFCFINAETLPQFMQFKFIEIYSTF